MAGANDRARIVFHVGGPAFHPVAEQAQMIAGWLGDGYEYCLADGLEAFERLDRCDLFVAMGLHWTGMAAEWAGSMAYHPLQPRHQAAFEAYVAAGKPIIAHHGGIAAYDDWPRYGELLGFTWVWDVTTHSPLGEHRVNVLPTGHAVVAGVEDYTLYDELYYNVQISAGLQTAVHAAAAWEGQARPMIITAEGGRAAGAGRTAYLANGHDMRAFACPALRQIWQHAVNWALG
jgi:type 1 glutamine amidotransferase